MGTALLSLMLAHGAAAGCRALAVPVVAGDVVDAARTLAVPCGGAAGERKLRYDARAGVVRARIALAAGEPIGRAYLPPRPPVLAGDRVAIAVRTGPVTLIREAVALQAAPAGRKFFVRSGDGAVFVAPPVAQERR
jgi:hypothetical protein